jgi:hypothetical protein
MLWLKGLFHSIDGGGVWCQNVRILGGLRFVAVGTALGI